MKKFIYLLYVLVAITINPAMSAVAGEFSHEFVFNNEDCAFRTVTAPDGNDYLRILSNNLDIITEEGEPEIPAVIGRFVVPVNSCNYRISITHTEIENIRVIENAIFPTQGSFIKENCEKEFIQADYTKESLHNKYVRLIDDSYWHTGHHVITLAVFPMTYNHEANTITQFKRVNVSVNFDESNSENDNVVKGVTSAAYSTSIHKYIPNPSSDGDNGVVNSQSRAASSQKNLGVYYIITTEKLASSFNELATWKRQKGYNVVVKTIESIKSDSKYSANGTRGREDDASSVREYLKDEYAKDPRMFCLLAGSWRDGFPIRWIRDSGNTHEISYSSPYYNDINGHAFIPTDNYFSDMKSEWKLSYDDNASIYTLPSNSIKPIFSVPVGRLMCRTSEEVRNYTDKLILYESNPGYGDTEYLSRAFAFFQSDMKNDTISFMSTFENLFDKIKILKDSYIDTGKVGYPKGVDVIEELPLYGYSSWYGHGNPGCVCTSGASNKKHFYIKALNKYTSDECFINNDESNNGLDKLDNGNYPFVAYSIACDVSPFDNLRTEDGFVYDMGYNVGESFTLGKKYGGPALLSNTRSGLFSHWGVGPSAKLEQNFGGLLKDNRKIGIAEMMSKELYTSSTLIRFTHSLIGDPEFEIWLDRPKSFNPSVSLTGNTFSIRDNNLAGSVIVLYNGDVAQNAYKCSTLSESLFFNPTVDGLLSYSIWKQGFLPYSVLKSYKGELHKKADYVVRTAKIGHESKYTIGENGNLNVRAIDSVSLGMGLMITENGNLSVRCNKDIDIQGVKIESNGKLNIAGSTMSIGAGFKVEKGGSVKISPEK